MTNGPDPVRMAAEAIVEWLRARGIDDAKMTRREGSTNSSYTVSSYAAPPRWPLQIGGAQRRGELEWPNGVQLSVLGGEECAVREGTAVLMWPYDNDHNEAWWDELGQPVRPTWPRKPASDE